MNYTGDRVTIRFFRKEDAAELLGLMVRNRSVFEKVSPERGVDFYTLEEQVKKIELCAKEQEEGRRYSFGIFLNETGELIGDVSLFKVERGRASRCILGYALDGRYHGKGYMSEAVSLILRFAFKEIGLHRIEAGVMPSNPGSARVLEKAGFTKEGLSRKNVNINGKWENHWLFAMLDEDYERLIAGRQADNE